MFHFLFFVVKGTIRVIFLVCLSVVVISFGTEAIAQLDGHNWHETIRKIDKPAWLSTKEGDLRLPEVSVEIK